LEYTIYGYPIYLNTSGEYINQTEIRLKPCTISDFPGVESQYESLKLKEALCPTFDTNLTIYGNYQDDTFIYFGISLRTCNETQWCQNYNNISQTMERIGFHLK